MDTSQLKTRSLVDAWVIAEVRSGIYEKHVKLRPNDIVADVGAHIGAFTVIAAKKASLVYAFEPDPANFEMLKQNMVFLRLEDRVTWENVAVLDKPGETVLKKGTMSVTSSVGEGMGTPVPAISLDTRLQTLDFLKIDAESSELKILVGSVRLLKENNVRIAMEVHSAELLRETITLLGSLGYTTAWEPQFLTWLLWAWKE